MSGYMSFYATNHKLKQGGHVPLKQNWMWIW